MTKTEQVINLPERAYQVFKKKGDMNSIKVRRIMQITKDLTNIDFSKLSILDLGCAEGVYSIEAALRGAHVLGIDGRSERVEWGQEIVEEIGLTNISFKQDDVRNVNKVVYGEFDVIYCLGLLYHIHYPAVFDVLNNIFKICNKAVIIDLSISLRPTCEVSYNGMTYEGHMDDEHGKDDPNSLVKARLAHSLTKEASFLFTRQSLYRALCEMGFSSVYECYVPLEGSKPQSRITMAAMKSSKVKISSYPWLNDMTEEEISKLMLDLGPWKNPWQIAPVETSPSRNIMSWSPKIVLKKCVKVILNKLGYEIHRINPST